MADKIENFEDFFPPLARGAHHIFDQGAVGYLTEKQINMAQEIIQRFGLCYHELLEQALTGETSVSNGLEKRVSTIQNRYTEILKTGSSVIGQKLTETSSLSGRSADKITNNYWTILKYLPMASEEVSALLLCSPENGWTPLLRASFENFQEGLSEEMKKGTSELFDLTDQSTDVSCARKVLLSRAAFPSAPEKFTPFLIVFAEWLAYKPHPNLSGLCRLLNISESFLRKKSSSLREEVVAYNFPQNLNFRAFLACRSAHVFCKNTNLRLSQTGLQKLMRLFLHDELLRSAWVFFSASQELQKLKPSDKTLLLPHHLLICFWNLKKTHLAYFEQYPVIYVRCFLNRDGLEITTQQALALLSLLFEWLILANPIDQERFFTEYNDYRTIRILTTIQDLTTLDIPSENALKAFLIFMNHYEPLSNLAGESDSAPLITTSLIYRWVLSGEKASQESFFKATDLPFPHRALNYWGNAFLPDNQMLPVLTFLFRNQETALQVLLFIETLPLSDLVKQELKLIFFQYIYENKGPVFWKITVDFQRLLSDLACKELPQSVEGDETRLAFYRTCAPIFVWCVKGSGEARDSFFSKGPTYSLGPFLRSLEIMERVQFEDEKKLLLWLEILSHIENIPKVLAFIESLHNQVLQEVFLNALCNSEADRFIQIYLVFVKFKGSIKSAQNVDYVFEWMIEAPKEIIQHFSSLLDTTPPVAFASSLNLMTSLNITAANRLEIFIFIVEHLDFLLQIFHKLMLFKKDHEQNDMQQHFIERYRDEIGKIKLHVDPSNTEQEKTENMALCRYVTKNLDNLQNLLEEYSSPTKEVLINLCFDPLTAQRLHSFNQFFSPFTLTTKKTPAIYEALFSFIRDTLTQDHIGIVNVIFTELRLFSLPYDIFAIINAFKVESTNITKKQATKPLSILKGLTQGCLDPLQAILLFSHLLKVGDEVAEAKFEGLRGLEETTSFFLNGEDTFEWIMNYPGDNNFLTQLQVLQEYRKKLEQCREQPSLPPALCQSISDATHRLHVLLDSYNIQEPTARSLKRHISTALILFDMPDISDFFSWEQLKAEAQINIPLDPRYPSEKKIHFQWKLPSQEEDFPRLVILGYEHLEIPLPIPPDMLECYSQVLNFIETLFKECSKEDKKLTGNFDTDLKAFSELAQAQWTGAELHKTDEEKKGIGKAAYQFALKINVALRKRRYIVSAKDS